ncbi:ABC transporter permease [Fundicoccus culcitae]|uniref:ABC transporter permease subunit n=1 Tax=Fundicoccus culcitae TaxID=2969821 RepID=A0ABY5P4D4_9LACT|nr:ABC transporter permease subunit [Fundicoccus culcitae]UUX33475.1 ABC transporter permease subunit [Fundicoccus culcitae]
MSPKRYYHAVGPRKFWNFVIFAIFLLFFYTPLVNNIMIAFGDTYRYPNVIPQEFGLRWWEFIFSQDQLVESIITSFVVATLTTIISLIVGVPAAYAISRYNFVGRKFFMFTFLISNAFPKMGIYVAMAIIFYRLNLMGTLPGVIIIHLINTLMFMIWLPAGSFRSVHRQQEEAARDVGASPFMVFRKITLPLAMPGIAVASVYTFLGSMEEAQGTLLVGFPDINTMATAMYGIILDYPLQAGAVFSLILMVPSIIVIWLFRKYLSADALGQGFKMK